MVYTLLIWKRRIEDILIYPFIWWGNILSRRKPLSDNYEIFFFFPFYHIGGAEKVHTLISAAAGGRKAIIFFTRKSGNDFFLQDFVSTGHKIIDLSAYTDNKLKYWNNLIYRGIISAYINQQDGKKMVFNGQSNFGYKLSRWIKPEIPQVELIHSFGSFSYIRIPFIEFYRETIMISKTRILDHLNLYKNYGIPVVYNDRITYILNGIPLPEQVSDKSQNGKELRLLYAGRDTPEKRVHIVRAIGQACLKAGLPVSVQFMGDVSGALKGLAHSNEIFYGNISDPERIHRIYENTDILLITSGEEGFPMVVMEAMARGCIILATPVGDLSVHIMQGINGFLFSQISDEQKIIREAVEIINKLQSDPSLLMAISSANIKYAREHFGLVSFEKHYQKLFDKYLS